MPFRRFIRKQGDDFWFWGFVTGDEPYVEVMMHVERMQIVIVKFKRTRRIVPTDLKRQADPGDGMTTKEHPSEIVYVECSGVGQHPATASGKGEG